MPAAHDTLFRILLVTSVLAGAAHAGEDAGPISAENTPTPCLERAAAVAYLHRFQDQIMRSWVIPEDTLSDQTIAVRFRLSEDGSVSAWKLRSWTSHRIANSVELAFRHAAPVGPIPAAAACLVDRTVEMHFENPY